MAIIGVSLATASISIGQAEGRRLSAQAEQVALVLESAADRAASLSRPHRLVLSPQGYQVEEFFRGQWRAPLGRPLQPRAWGDGIAPLGPSAPLLIDRDGLGLPVLLRLSLGGRQALVQWNGLDRPVVMADEVKQ